MTQRRKAKSRKNTHTDSDRTSQVNGKATEFDPSQPLEHGKYEAFAQFCAVGTNRLRAYEAAGFTPDRGHGSRLAADGRVRARIDWLRDRAAATASWSLETLIMAADTARRHSAEVGQMTASVLAIKELGILTGLRVERREVATLHVEDMSTSELLTIARRGRLAAELPPPSSNVDGTDTASSTALPAPADLEPLRPLELQQEQLQRLEKNEQHQGDTPSSPAPGRPLVDGDGEGLEGKPTPPGMDRRGPHSGANTDSPPPPSSRARTTS